MKSSVVNIESVSNMLLVHQKVQEMHLKGRLETKL